MYKRQVIWISQQPRFKSNLTLYLLENGYGLDKAAQFIQFFQVITIDEDKLTYVAYTATGKEYDRMVISKDPETGKKRFLNK